MDHEFFTGAMAADLAGWEWFSLQLGDGWEVMLYLLRQKDGAVDPASSGTLIDPQGRTRHLKLAEFTSKPLAPGPRRIRGSDTRRAGRLPCPGPGTV